MVKAAVNNEEAKSTEKGGEKAGDKGAVKSAVKSAKGAKARARLKAAALVVLDRVGYHKMRIADVTKEAGVAQGLFYHYFDDLKSLTVEVLSDYVTVALNVEEIEKNVPKGDWFSRIYAHNLIAVKSYANRPGLMRCLLQLADEDEEFGRKLRSNFVEQLGWLVKLMPSMFPKAKFTEHQGLMVVYTLAGTAEALLRDFYIHREPMLTRHEVQVEQMAELITVMFYRALFLENPPAEKLRYTHSLLAMKGVKTQD